ncbi:MAG: hypothetical protein JWR37_5758 [Mycobacterium sp.]|nr:hypothetical protein [Mycobacterium sp.]
MLPPARQVPAAPASWAHKTLYCGDRLFTADDRESSRIARISSGMRDSQTRCLAVENEQQAERSDPQFGNPLVAGFEPRPPHEC